MPAGSYSPGSIHSTSTEEAKEEKGAKDAQGAAARSAESSALNPPTLQATAGAPVRLLLQLHDKLGLPTRLRAGRPVFLLARRVSAPPAVAAAAEAAEAVAATDGDATARGSASADAALPGGAVLGLHTELVVLPLNEASGGGDHPIGGATSPTAEAVEEAPGCRATLETRVTGVWLLSLSEEDPRRRLAAAAAETPLARLEVVAGKTHAPSCLLEGERMRVA